MSSKKELLEELKIDRSEAAKRNAGQSSTNKLLLALVSILTLGLVYLWLNPMQQTEPSLDSVNKSEKPAQRTQQTLSNIAATNKDKQPSAEKLKPVVNSGDKVLDVSGYITARRVATVSAKIFGLLTEVMVEEGAKVEQGQVLAQLDARIAQIDLDRAKANFTLQQLQIEQNEIELKQMRRDLKRSEELFKKNYSDEALIMQLRSDIEVKSVALDSAKTNLTVRKLQIDQLQQQLDDYTIRAPFAGVVTVKNAQAGEIISPSAAGGGFTRTGICTIVDMDSLEIEVDVNESFISEIREGQKVTAKLYAYDDWTFDGQVEKVVPTVDRAKATVRVRIKILVKDPRILPNMAVKISFIK